VQPQGRVFLVSTAAAAAVSFNACVIVASEVESQLHALHPSPLHGSYVIYIVPEGCTFIARDSAIIGTHRSAFVSYSQGSVCIKF